MNRAMATKSNRKKRLVQSWVETPLASKLDERAEAKGMSRSEAVAAAVEEWCSAGSAEAPANRTPTGRCCPPSRPRSPSASRAIVAADFAAADFIRWLPCATTLDAGQPHTV